MNKNGRPWLIPPEELEPLIRTRREKGEAIKVIANALGYSADRIKRLCVRWKIYKGLKPDNLVALEDKFRRNNGRDHAPSANVPAGPEAKPADSGEPRTPS